jgi:hypothetical protein
VISLLLGVFFFFFSLYGEEKEKREGIYSYDSN